MGLSRAEYEQRTPRHTPVGQQAVYCWNFAGGFDVDKLLSAAVFYEVQNLDLMLHLLLGLRHYLDKTNRTD